MLTDNPIAMYFFQDVSLKTVVLLTSCRQFHARRSGCRATFFLQDHGVIRSICLLYLIPLFVAISLRFAYPPIYLTRQLYTRGFHTQFVDLNSVYVL